VSSGIDLNQLPAPSRNTLFVAVGNEEPRLSTQHPEDFIWYFKIIRQHYGVFYVYQVTGASPHGRWCGQQRTNGDYIGSHTEQLAQVVAHPEVALSLYGTTIGRCGHCRRTLTDPESRARGIGPVCYGRTQMHTWASVYDAQNRRIQVQDERRSAGADAIANRIARDTATRRPVAEPVAPTRTPIQRLQDIGERGQQTLALDELGQGEIR
jgi:hypothetical protein